MRETLLHNGFEAAAWLCAVFVGWHAKRQARFSSASSTVIDTHPLYLVLVWMGAVIGAFGLGSANLALSGVSESGRSILGAMAGGIVGAESYKLWAGIRGSTGHVFVVPLASAIAIGRIGCFFGGLADYTYGTETHWPWGVDFGDGVPRHPVQLYESFAMVGFLALFLYWRRRHRDECLRLGFYLFVGFYAMQRFAWESLKPYGTVLGPLNLFHLVCLVMIVYALAMARNARRLHAAS